MVKSKLQREYQIEDDGTTVIPKEILPLISQSALKNTVKRERTEAQKANFAKVVEANKERWAKLRADKEAMAAQAKQQAMEAIKKGNQEKIEADTHVRVKIEEKRVFQPRKKNVVEEPASEVQSDEEVVIKKPREKPVKPVKKRVVYETDTPTETETDDTDIEEYKAGKRQIRREVKKNIRAIEKIDSLVLASAKNPYTALFESRWR